MALDRFVSWDDPKKVPSRDAIGKLCKNYVGSAGDVKWDEDRFFITLPGRCSYALHDQDDLPDGYRAAAKEAADDP